jgi:heme/copper-type cytochrome/quinol oxidase subunit 2
VLNSGIAPTLIASGSAAAAATDPATTAGLVVGRLLFFVVGGLMLYFGLRKRSAAQRDPSQKSNGKGLIIAGTVVLVLSVLALAATSGR